MWEKFQTQGSPLISSTSRSNKFFFSKLPQIISLTVFVILSASLNLTDSAEERGFGIFWVKYRNKKWKVCTFLLNESVFFYISSFFCRILDLDLNSHLVFIAKVKLTASQLGEIISEEASNVDTGHFFHMGLTQCLVFF